ncbi:MAG TPA: hypothetical protein VMU30_05685 [Bacteroidota bacterium]|nr:hypothetical protein [Bacteroidota bacterium]
MTALRNNLKEFIQLVENDAGKKFKFPDEVALLLDLSLNLEKQKTFDELLFHAAAVIKTQEVMKRIGSGAEGYDQLSSEFQSNAQCVTALARELLLGSDHAQSFENRFLAFETESFFHLTQLCADLRLIKNWEVDGKQLPTWESITKIESRKKEIHRTDIDILYRRTKRNTILAFALLMLMAFIDPPVTMLGWCVTITVFGLLAYIYFLVEEMWKRIMEKKR